MDMYKVVFLILNYNSISELKECVESIQRYGQDYFIVVVDNGSEASEVGQLVKYCGEREDIYLIKSAENLGFARGNNLGFRYIRQNIRCNYIAMINSDTLLISSGFCEQLDSAYAKYRFAVLGPDILPSRANPIINELDHKEKVLRAIRETELLIKVMGIPGVNFGYLGFNKMKNKVYAPNRENLQKPIEGCVLHGCFLVFSELYTRNGLCDETFLYGEEDILAKDCRDNELKMLFYPNIKIIHNESKATKRSIPKLIQRKLFYLTNRLDSLNVLLSKYEQGKDTR